MDTEIRRKQKISKVVFSLCFTLISAFCGACGTIIGASNSCLSTQSRLPNVNTVARCFRFGRELVEKNEILDRGRSSAPSTSSLSGFSSN